MSSIFVKTGVLSRVSPIRISHKHPPAVGRLLRNRVVRLSGDDAVLSSSVDHEPGTVSVLVPLVDGTSLV